MIESNELRIGNLFFDEDKTPCYFAGAWQRKDGWIYRDSAGNTYKDTQMYPILLTTEILLKCGFEKGWVWNLDLYDNCKLLFYADTDVIHKCQISQGYDTFDIPNIKFLHQLQNFVYAFSQKELEIKL